MHADDEIIELTDIIEEGAPITSGLGDFPAENAVDPQSLDDELDALLEDVAPDLDPLADLDNSPDSVFCSHGAGVIVPWDEVPARAHVSSGLDLGPEKEEPAEGPDTRRASAYAGTIEQDKELQAIFERTYGAVKRESFLPPKAPKRPVADNSEEKRRELKQAFSGEDYLLVDGYNIIFAWDELKKAAAEKYFCSL